MAQAFRLLCFCVEPPSYRVIQVSAMQGLRLSSGSTCDHPGATPLDCERPRASSDVVSHTSFQENSWQAGQLQHKGKERYTYSRDLFGSPRVQQTLRSPGVRPSAGLGRSFPRSSADHLRLDLQGSSRTKHARVWVDDEFQTSTSRGSAVPSESYLRLETPQDAGRLPLSDSLLPAPAETPEVTTDVASEVVSNELESDDKENERPVVVQPFQSCNRHRALRQVHAPEPLVDDVDDLDEFEMDFDFESENLAEKLEERVRRNTDGFYDFEIYTDPMEC
uniref:Uncharacterized protein n=1 Tax=Noctiluca scintillans TaxID=2966 RepID=A0A7S1AP04_NOCSC